MHKVDQIRQVLQPELCPGFQPARLQCSATCKISSQGHPIHQGIVPACMCSEMPCSRRLFQSAGQWRRGFDDFEIVWRAICRGHRIVRSKQKIQHHWRRAKRMCFEPSPFLRRATVCYAEMEIESWWPWLWFVGWDAASRLWKWENCGIAWWPNCLK